MSMNRLCGTLALAAVAALAACSNTDAGDDAAVTDTLVTQDTVTREVEVAVPDTQAVVTDVDTTQDTVDISDVRPDTTP
jgi:hypothetical protein